MVEVGETVPISTVDWRGHCCTTIFLSGCPFNCVYCSNAGLIDGSGAKIVLIDDIMNGITDAKGFIDGVVFSGGEPTMQRFVLEELARHTKRLGLKVAIQTNGYYPMGLMSLLTGELVDAVMLDIKAPLVPEKYVSVTGVDAVMSLKNTIHLIKKYRSRLEYIEVRTVVFEGMNDNETDLCDIANALDTCDAYVIVQGISDISANKELREVPLQKVMALAESVVAKTSVPVWVRSRAGEVKVG